MGLASYGLDEGIAQFSELISFCGMNEASGIGRESVGGISIGRLLENAQ